MRESTPPQSGVSTPVRESSRETSPRTPRQPEIYQSQQHQYWNEYDNGSEAGDANEPYTIYIDPDADSNFPGAKSITYVISRLNETTKLPFEKIRSWLSPHTTPQERRPLLSNRPSGYFSARPNSAVDTEIGSDDDISSNEFPPGYEAHYATFPSVSDQKLTQNRERLLFRGTLASFFAAFLLLFVAALLVVTGRHRLRVEVDAGLIIGVVASLFFATLGFTTMLCRWARLGVLHITCVTASFLTVCVLSGFLLVFVMGNTSLP
jgi:hypothetical protein